MTDDGAFDPSADKEKAEGDRDTVDQALEQEQGERQGISNRPAREEAREQQELPPRGQAKKPDPGGHA